MFHVPNETPRAEDFVIENNIIKGRPTQFPDNFQVGKLFFDILSSKPDHVSQIEAETGKKTTFAEMKERSVRCALWLKKQGIGSQDVILIRSDDNASAYIPIFASFYLGATYNALNHLLPLEDSQELMRILQPKVLFLSGNATEMVVQAAKKVNENVKIIVCDNYPGFQSLNSILEGLDYDEVKNFQPEIIASSEDIAYIILSSGTSALPKPVVHSYGNLIKQIFVGTTMVHNIILWYAPTYWASGFGRSLRNVFLCKTRIIHAKFDPEETCEVIEKYKVEQISLAPSTVDRFCQSNVLKKYQLKSLKLLTVGGSKVNQRMLKELHKSLPHVSVRQMYGCSEVGIPSIEQTENCKNIYSVGYINPSTDIKIRDLKTNQAVGPNTHGELCMKSCCLMKGYFKNEQATKEVIDEEGWYYTEDLAYYNEDCEFFILDRIKDAILYKNHLIWPHEIENALQHRDDILEAAVISIPHETDGDRPIAYVSKAPDSNVTEEVLMRLLENLYENEKLHVVVKFIDKLPRLGAGKIVKRKLIEAARAM